MTDMTLRRPRRPASIAATLALGFAALLAGPGSDAVAADGQPREASMKDLEAIVDDARLVSFGESSHFLQGMHSFAARAFRHLAEEKGFRVFVFESAWGVEDALREFFASDRAELTQDEGFFLNAFNSPETVALLRWIREFNRRHPDDPIRVAGYQPEQPVTDFQALWAFAGQSKRFRASGLQEKAAPCKASSEAFRTNLDFFRSLFEPRRQGKPTYTPEERAACLEALEEIDHFLKRNRRELIRRTSPGAFEEARLHVLSLRTFIDTIMRAGDALGPGSQLTPEQELELSRDSYTAIDATRFEIFQTLKRTRYAGKKMFLWMHNWHAAMHSEDVESIGRGGIPKGTISFGTRLARAYGDELVTIGSIVGCPGCESPGREDSFGPRLARHFGDGSALIDLRGRDQALVEQLGLRGPGGIYQQLHQSYLLVDDLGRQFDAIYYLSASKRVGEP